MNRRAGPAIFVLCFALVPWVLEACGTARNVLEEDPALPDTSDAGWGGDMMAMGAGGVSFGGRFSAGGVPVFGGNPSIADGSPGAGGGPGAGGASDPNAELRRSLAEELCTIPDRFPCLSLSVTGAPPSATGEELRTLCRQKTESSQYTLFGEPCFGQWANNAACALRRTDYCPCDGDAGTCVFTPESHSYGRGCEGMSAELNACSITKNDTGIEEGAAGPYQWADGALGCTVEGTARNGVDKLAAKCSGPPSGAQACNCTVNGVTLYDAVQILIRSDSSFYADDCKSVATRLAAGQCADVLDCCFTDSGGTCSCGAHPDLAGYSSCEELAAAQSAVVVDHCPAHRP